MTEYSLHTSEGDSTTINAESDIDALHAAEEVAEELGSPCVEVYRVQPFKEGNGFSMETLTYIGSRP